MCKILIHINGGKNQKPRLKIRKRNITVSQYSNLFLNTLCSTISICISYLEHHLYEDFKSRKIKNS